MKQLPYFWPAGVWVDTPWVVGEFSHKRAECALNNQQKSQSSFMRKKPNAACFINCSSADKYLLSSCSDRKQIRDSYTTIWRLVTASRNIMFGKTLPSDQLHSFPIVLELQSWMHSVYLRTGRVKTSLVYYKLSHQHKAYSAVKK